MANGTAGANIEIHNLNSPAICHSDREEANSSDSVGAGNEGT